MDRIRDVQEFNPQSIPLISQKETDMFQFKTDLKDFKDFNGESLVKHVHNNKIFANVEDDKSNPL
jgi:hypothetical protein